jgi:hypothetical protein
MPVPAVSPENWQRTTIICSLEMGTPVQMADELSFQDRLEILVDQEDSYLDEARSNEEDIRNSSKVLTHSDFQSTPDDPHQAQLTITQSKPHRPDVDVPVVKMLETAVKREKDSVPAEKFDFNTNLGILLDAAERYYETLNCEIVKSRTAPDLSNLS